MTLSTPFPYSSRAPAPNSRRHNYQQWRSEYQAQATLLARYQQVVRDLPEGFVEIVLLTDVPSAEGGNIRELSGYGYKRQSAKFAPTQARGVLRNSDPIQFDLIGEQAPQIKCVGVMVDGMLYFYGRLDSSIGAFCDEDGAWPVIIGQQSLTLAFRREG